MKVMTPEQINLYIDIARFKKRQSWNEDRGDWFDRCIDNMKSMLKSEEPKPKLLPHERSSGISLSNEARSQYRTDRMESLYEYASTMPDGFTVSDAFEWWSENCKHPELLVTYITMTNNLRDMANDGKLTTISDDGKRHITYLYKEPQNAI